MEKSESYTIDARPHPKLYETLKSDRREHWEVLTEFIDNAIQSFIDNKSELQKKHPGKILQINIEVNSGPRRSIVISDNAGGIPRDELERASRLGAAPKDSSGLNQYGMGMKRSAFWYCKCWTIETRLLGEKRLHRIEFDMDQIKKDGKVVVHAKEDHPVRHGTTITLTEFHPDLDRFPSKQKLPSIRTKLSEIYRQFLCSGDVSIKLGGQALRFEYPDILQAPRVGENEPKKWRKDINIDLGRGDSINGFVAILEAADEQHAGFSMFHRRRLIYSPKDPKNRKVQPFKFFPELIFSPQYPKRLRRLTGDLEIKGAEVTTNKSEYLLNDKKIEEIFVNVLVDEIRDILQQVDRYVPPARSKEEKSGKGKQMGSGSPPVGKGRPKVLPSVPENEAYINKLENDRKNRLLGFFGELFVISQSADVIKTIEAWRIERNAPFDFINEQARLEVKTTKWEKRSHYFTVLPTPVFML